MSASALRPKTNTRRLLYFLVISLVVHIVMLFGTSIDYMFGSKPVAPATTEGTAPVVVAPGATAPAVPASGPASDPTSASTASDKPAEKKSPKDTSLPAAPAKPKDADAEYNKRQKPATDQEKRQAESIRPDLDALK